MKQDTEEQYASEELRALIAGLEPDAVTQHFVARVPAALRHRLCTSIELSQNSLTCGSRRKEINDFLKDVVRDKSASDEEIDGALGCLTGAEFEKLAQVVRSARGPEEEYCPHCDARLERDPHSGTCNRCGKKWSEKTSADEQSPRNTDAPKWREGIRALEKLAAYIPNGGTVSYDYYCDTCGEHFDGNAGKCPLCGRDRSATTTNPKLKKSAASAEGIPDRSEYGDVTKLPLNELVPYVIQKHYAQRAGTHHDVRLSAPGHGLLSWATRKEIPLPGERPIALFRQPLHSEGYASFQGTIPKGYGAGVVKTHTKGEALITKVAPDEVHFTSAHTGDPQRYVLKKTDDKRWILLNTTPTDPVTTQKIRYISVPHEKAEEILKNIQPGTSVQAKVDGSASLTKLMKDKAEAVSYRTATTGLPIPHTERLWAGLPRFPVPKDLQGLTLRGELYGVDKDTGRAVPPQTTGGLLNAAVGKSIRAQRDKNVELKNMVFDVQGPHVQGLTYPERLDKVRSILERLPQLTPKYHVPEEAKTPEEALALWDRVRTGREPLSDEGVVVHPPAGKPTKIKIDDEHNVLIRNFTPGQGKYQNRGVGAFTYSLTPEGPVLGNVGTGLSDETRARMYTNPEEFAGRTARVRAQSVFPSGALRAPRFVALDESRSQVPVKSSASADFAPFRRAKYFSDLGAAGDPAAYAEKANILTQLITAAPDRWVIDSEGPYVYGLTHVPSGWRYHLPKKYVERFNLRRADAPADKRLSEPVKL